MAEWTEKYGTDVDDAVKLALDELNLTEDQVMVTVIEEPSKGFLGLGSKLARVRVEKLSGEEVVEEISQAEALKREEKKQPVKANHDFRKKNKVEGRTERAERPERFDRQDRPDRKERDGNRPPRSNDRKPREREEVVIEIDFDERQLLCERPEDLAAAPDSEAFAFVSDILSKMNLDVEVSSFANDDCFYLEITGEDSKMVIGKRGQTLDSLQYLTNLVSNKGQEEYKRVIIDVEGYRSRREKTLEQLAVKLAKKVLRSGRLVKLEPMNPYERKVIHATLQQVSGVKTRSEGEEPYRRVIIEKK
ncbi:MAG: protein jag [Clostridiales Family XIII bacterium]|jgi:spoIIIJ-associated protein|nr:protein jag [Clostridiales Family XIII bacterium]